MANLVLTKEKKEDKLHVFASGRIDSSNSFDLQSFFNDIFVTGEKKIILDFNKIEYISSAGLRVVLFIQKKINSLGVNASFKVINVAANVKEVFDMTGFSDIIMIKTQNEDSKDIDQTGEN
ncbi:MAG: anti-sigma factor antagonist [Candidatus Improbicoccus devescovinae]|nr:MAG: anti-sigma factor antagonist [Candidatus Improbicoccus devescovinae]